MITSHWIQRIIDFCLESKSTSSNIGNAEYTYYAFISYTKKDEYWAKWLQWNLEHYKIPTKIRKERNELPKKVKPVFWYKNDLAGAHLSGSIKKELARSKHMIVVCSPASANAEWVNDEVKIYKEELGRGNNIIPFVVKGKINAEHLEQECLPVLLRNLSHEEQLRCIDVHEYGKNKALVNIVSTLFDIRFGVLWDRFKHEQQRLIAIYSTIAILCCAILFGVWDYFLHTKYEYFVDYADCNGIPTGIIQIDNDEAEEHYRLYRFEYCRRTLQRVVYVDSNGNPQNHTNTELADRPSIQILSYNNGELTAIDCKNETGKTLYIMHLSKDKFAADLKDEDENQAANFIFSSTSVDQGNHLLQQSTFLDRMLKSPSKIARYIYERDDYGYIKRKMFGRHNGDNDDISIDANGISGFEYERDSFHRIIKIKFLDNHYAYKANNMGIAGKRYRYDQYGNLTVAEYVDKNGNLKYNEHHWAKVVDVYDRNGYCIEERVYGADGKPCISALGYHKQTIRQTENQETISLFDLCGNPTYQLPLGDIPGGFSKSTIIRNKDGRIKEIHFMDSEGNLCYNQHHVAIQKFEYNDMGFVIGIRNYGIDKRPCSNINGYFYEHHTYNQQGYLTTLSVYNVNELPTQNNFGFHRFRMKYDDTGRRMTEVHADDSNGLPVYCQLFNGAAWIKLGYHGSSKWPSEIAFYTHNNKPAELPNLGAKITCKRDTYGQIIEYKYYNADYELSSNEKHCAIMKLSYNEMGMETDRSFYDKNNSPIGLNTEVFHINRCYTETGQLEKICCYDTIQNLRENSEGWAMQKFCYSNGVIYSNAFYGENRECIEIMGVHKYTSEVDDCGYLLSQSAYNKDLQPTINLQTGAHKIINLYDDKRRVVGRDYYDNISKEPFVKLRLKLNQRGMQTEQFACNSNNKLVESPLNLGVAKIKSEYDSQDRITYLYATNKRGEKMNTSYGYAEAYFSYGSNMQEGKFLDSSKKLVNNNSLSTPCAYSIMYSTDTGQQLYCKILRCSNDDNIEAIRDVYCYDTQGLHVVKAIRCEKELVRVYDTSSNQTNNYYSFDDEYDEYNHIADSIQLDVESKYGKPKLYPSSTN